MNRYCVTLVLLLMTMTGGIAQQGSGIDLGLSTGYVIPSTPMSFANYWKMQYNVGAEAGLALSPVVTLTGAVEYTRFILYEDGLKEGYDAMYARDIWIFDDVTFYPVADPSSVVTLSANLRVSPEVSGFVSPYVTGGGGIMWFALSEILLQPTSTLTVGGTPVEMMSEQTIVGGKETVFFMQAGVGLHFNVSSTVRPFIEARYVIGLTGQAKPGEIPLTAGVRIAF
jgi:opacity protein-like surface antigen